MVSEHTFLGGKYHQPLAYRPYAINITGQVIRVESRTEGKNTVLLSV